MDELHRRVAPRRVTDPRLPALYKDFNSTSIDAQQRYFRLMCWNLVLLVAGALTSSYSALDVNVQRWIYGVGAFLFGSGLIVTVVLLTEGFERKWYGGRAGAESVKTLAWKYMMRAKPFDAEHAQGEVDQEFIAGLDSVLVSRRDLAINRSDITMASEPITPTMREVRLLSTVERLQIYLNDRIQDQINWYSRKAADNAKCRRIWFAAIIATQAIALAMSILQAVEPRISVNLAGVMATTASAFLAWLQLKRHQELAQSYALTAHELGFVGAKGRYVRTDDQLSDFVSDAENAISREHTMWVARRDTP